MGGLIGTSVPRRDAPAKVTGAARYTDDLLAEGAWFGLTVRSDEPHARLVAIERDPVFDWSRVVVVTAPDIPGENVVTLMYDDQPALVAEEIRHHGEAVALVAGPSPAVARAARSAIRLRTEPLPPVLDPLMSDKAFAQYEILKGDLEAGFAEADLVLEGEYRTGPQEHVYIEPQAMIAVPESDGGVTVTGSLQCPYYVHAALARALALPTDRVRVVQAETGGGFGGKEEYPSMLAIHAALLARAAGRPVRMTYDRHEDIVATTKRHPAVIRQRTGVTAEGRLVAQDIDVVLNAGAYATLSPVVLSRAAIHATGPYRCPNVRVRARASMTHMVPSGAFRGFGAPETEFAAEVHMARIAEALGMPASELRHRLAYREGDVTATGQRLRNSVAAIDVLGGALRASGFDAEREATAWARAERKKAGIADDRTAQGVGLALGWHGAGFTGSGERVLASAVGIELTAEARIRVLTAQTEIGQGSASVLPQIAAETLGVAADAVEPCPLDTALVPNSGPTVASRTTMVIGGLIAEAAGKLRREVEERTHRPFAESYASDAAAHGPTRIDVRFEGYPGIEWDQEHYRGDAYPAYSWAAAVAWVDVDLDTGQVFVRRVIAVDEVGRVVNPLLAAGQVEGGTLQAIGYATTEEMQVVEGRFRNDRLATYLIPTALDAPEIEAHLLEVPFPDTPHGAKGLGELPMDVGAPAVIDAIHDAIGAWITELPATPARVLDAIRAQEAEQVRARAEVPGP